MTGHAVTGHAVTGPAMTGSPVTGPYDPDHEDEVPVRQCGRCGAVGTHYLTCPALRLPPGYRISDPERRTR